MASDMPYRAWLSDIVHDWPELTPLLELLNDEPQTASAELAIIDLVDNSIQTRLFTTTRPDPTWKAHLTTPVPNSTLRIIPLVLQDEAVPTHWLDGLGAHLDLDPFLYMAHLRETKNQPEEQAWSGVAHLPSEDADAKIGFMYQDHATVHVVPGANPPTALVLITALENEAHFLAGSRGVYTRPRPAAPASWRRLPSSRIDSLLHWLHGLSPSEHTALSAHPMSLTVPLLRRHLQKWLARTDNDIFLATASCPLQQERWSRRVEDRHGCVRLPISNMDELLECWGLMAANLSRAAHPSLLGDVWRPEMARLMSDITAIRGMVSEVRAEWLAHRESCNDFHALAAAETAERTARDLGRVTILAFIFIPLSFVTSVFGMNLAVLGQGTADFWWPIIVAGILVAVALGAWAVSGPVQRGWTQVVWVVGVLVRFYGNWRPLIRRQPRAAWLFVRFVWAHPSEYAAEELLNMCALVDSVLIGNGTQMPIQSQAQVEKDLSWMYEPEWRERVKEIVHAAWKTEEARANRAKVDGGGVSKRVGGSVAMRKGVIEEGVA